MKKRSNRYLQTLEKVEKGKLYSKEEAAVLVKETSPTSFDATIDVAVKLNLDTTKVDQQLRGALVLPHGTGKTKKILVLAKGENAKTAKDAGADFVGDVDMIEKIDKEDWYDFDVIVATPDMMPALGKIGKKLGPKGLMPNPKTGTVTTDVKRTVDEIRKGRVTYKTDSFGIVHSLIGKSSFDAKKIEENLTAFMDLIYKVKPSTAKGVYVKSVSISSTMGPGIKIDLNSFDK